MLQSSFFADGDTAIKLQNVKQKQKIQPILEKSKAISCPFGCTVDDVRKIFDLIDELWGVNDKLYSKVIPAPL